MVPDRASLVRDDGDAAGALQASLRAERSNPQRSKRKNGLLRCARNDGWTAFRDLATHCVRGLFQILPLIENRGRREDRVRAAPAVPCANAQKRCAHEHTGSAEAFRPSLRSGFTAYFVLSPVNGFLATVAAQILLRKLDASTAASGPHDFAVRNHHARQAWLSRPPHLTARFVTMANAPHLP